MNEDGYTTPSTVRNNNAESADIPYLLAKVELEGFSSDTKPLPPKNLKRYTTRQLRRRHTEPWLIFSLLAIVGTILVAGLLIHSDPSFKDGCIDSDNSETEWLFRINLVVFNGLSFAEAKFIDLLWNTVVGQGGRFIHGLILHQLVWKALTLLLERSTLPYAFLLGIKFSTVSIESLWVCFRILFSKIPISTTFITVSLSFLIGHVLAFATIWSAATGYEADTVPAYDILDSGSFVLQDSDLLTTCWSVEDLNRVEQSLGKPITGPTFAQAYGRWEHIGDNKEFERLKMNTTFPEVKTSEAFRNIYAYAKAKETFSHRYQGPNLAYMDQINRTDTWYDNDCYKSDAETANGYNFTESCTRNSLYTSVVDWQDKTPGDSEYVPYNTTFILDEKIKKADRVVPYNSTLWWNSTRVKLGAPFLEIGTDCQWFGGSLGLCLCFDGNVLSKDFRTSHQICLNDTGYRWGFSGFVVLIGLALEAAWLVVCTVMWSVIITRSQLVRMHRPGTGVTRDILDIAGAINSSIGTDTGAYTEDELKKELEKCPPVGYDINNTTSAGYERLRLRPLRHVIPTRRKLRVNGHTLYG
ncbi:hypothetical protein F4782DRAFT_545518 [Xylaria castorea]|nr:hypothetical protein F4782DRAFT_545518 [Xylaria castorea]